MNLIVSTDRGGQGYCVMLGSNTGENAFQNRVLWQFLLLKSKFLSGQKTIGKWINLVQALPMRHSLASASDKLNKQPNSSKPSALSVLLMYHGSCHTTNPCSAGSRNDQHLSRHSMLILKGSCHQCWISIKGTVLLQVVLQNLYPPVVSQKHGFLWHASDSWHCSCVGCIDFIYA